MKITKKGCKHPCKIVTEVKKKKPKKRIWMELIRTYSSRRHKKTQRVWKKLW